jgi:uncharacterized membrane protein YphA (DoxX/SURF4 family)
VKIDWFDWFYGQMHDAGRSLDIVRLAVAVILITHPLYAFLHPSNIRGFGLILHSRDVPFAFGFAWGALGLQAVCSMALLVRRFVTPACVGHIVVLCMGVILVHAHAPSWRTVGLPDGDLLPGPEFNVLLIFCLCGVFWAHWSAATKSSPTGNERIATRRGLEIVGYAAPLILIVHPFGALREGFHNPQALNDLGHYFSSLGYPFGVILVWGAMYLQVVCSVALTLRRFVVPACIGHIYVLCTGIWLFHAPHWFVIGPENVVGSGEEGMEYSILLISCFFSLLLAYWPRRERSINPQTRLYGQGSLR